MNKKMLKEHWEFFKSQEHLPVDIYVDNKLFFKGLDIDTEEILENIKKFDNGLSTEELYENIKNKKYPDENFYRLKERYFPNIDDDEIVSALFKIKNLLNGYYESEVKIFNSLTDEYLGDFYDFYGDIPIRVLYDKREIEECLADYLGYLAFRETEDY